ncbi:MAG: imidazole glycerol phosphate synthase cyclase subunit [Candidatus Firestonebacteria bacterium]
MLKKRLIACLLLMDGQLVESIGFSKFLVIGNAIMAVRHFNAWEVDELVLLDINRKQNYDFGRDDVNYNNKIKELSELIRYISKSCFIPLTVGGGIRSVEDIHKYINAGADKVSINTAALDNLEIIREGSKMFGSQCIVVSIDAKKQPDGTHHVMKNFGTEDTGIDVVDWAKKVEEAGAGELFLTSVDQDGSYKGYDIYLVSSVANAVEIPVIASGGVGEWEHLVEGIKKGGASAVSVGNKFHFTEHSTMHAKKYMRERGIDLR